MAYVASLKGHAAKALQSAFHAVVLLHPRQTNDCALDRPRVRVICQVTYLCVLGHQLLPFDVIYKKNPVPTGRVGHFKKHFPKLLGMCDL